MGSLGACTTSLHPTTPRVLVVFDFDCSLVNDDSDAVFCKMFCPALFSRLLMPAHKPPPHGWPALMDELFCDFFQEKPHVTRNEVERAVGKIAVFPEMLDALRLVVDDYNATVVIISDANTIFIESMLENYQLRDYVMEIHANEGVWEVDDCNTTRLRVQPYHALSREPHGCPVCPLNLCKGCVLDTLRAKVVYDTVLYVGDGIGDFCPSTRLTERDTVFARADSADGKSFGLLHRLRSHQDQIHARIVEWNTGQDVYDAFRATFQSLSDTTSASST